MSERRTPSEVQSLAAAAPSTSTAPGEFAVELEMAAELSSEISVESIVEPAASLASTAETARYAVPTPLAIERTPTGDELVVAPAASGDSLAAAVVAPIEHRATRPIAPSSALVAATRRSSPIAAIDPGRTATELGPVAEPVQTDAALAGSARTVNFAGSSELGSASPAQAERSAQSPSPRQQLVQLFGDSGAAVPPAALATGLPASPAIDEITQLLGREISESTDAGDSYELVVRLALLLWDAYGRPDLALSLLDSRAPAGERPHPVATALRLHAAVDGGQSVETLLALVDKLPGDAQTRAEVGELLLFRGAYAPAAELLADCESPRLRALALALSGQPQEAAALLESSPASERIDLVWAAQLYEQAGQVERSQPPLQRACTLVTSATEESWSSALALLLSIERLHDLGLRSGSRRLLLPLLEQKLALLGGAAALAESQPELVVSNARALRRVELLSTALQLAGLLAEQGDAQTDHQAATLYDVIAGFAARHQESAAPLGRCLALVESARLCERCGDRLAAAERFEALGLLLLDLGGQGSGDSLGRLSGDRATRLDQYGQATALCYLLRAAELLTPRAADTGSVAHAVLLYGRLTERGVSDEVLTLRRLSLLLPSGREAHGEVVLTLSTLAETTTGSDSQRATARAVRAAEILRVPSADVIAPSAASDRPSPIGESRRDLLALLRRARRRGDHPQLAELYAQLSRQLGAVSTSDDTPNEQSEDLGRAGAIYREQALVLRLSLAESGQEDGQLQTLLDEAATRQPAGGLLIDVVRALLRRRPGGDSDDAGQSLSGLLGRLRSRESQILLYRQLGHWAAEHAGNHGLAESSFTEVLARRPDDVMALHALARLVAQRGETAQAAALLQQAVEAALRLPAERPDPVATGLADLDQLFFRRRNLQPADREVGAQAAALLCCELGSLYEALSHSADQPGAAIEQAITCYQEALRRDPRCRPAARALVALYRSVQRPAELLSAMELLLPLLHDDQQRLSLLIELGESATEQALALAAEEGDAAAGPSLELAGRAFRDALALQPDHPAAIRQLTELCQRTRRYSLLAESLQRAPRSLAVLSALREAYENLGQAQELALVYEEQLTLLRQGGGETREASVASLRALALIYQRLEQPEDEARTWERLYDLTPEALLHDVKVLLVLERRYGQGGRHTEQASLLSRALDFLAAEQTRHPNDNELRERRRLLLLRLGDVQRDSLAAPAQATATFEQVLTEWPEERTALRALLGLYSSQERGSEQLRTLTALLEVTIDPGERSRLLSQLAELDEKQGNIDDAYLHFGQAFYLDPSNRPAFTAYERLCYRREQWPEAIRIYDTALKLIESQKTRSYRPADLYVRRGQVLFQYLQNTDEALANYLRAMESDAENDATQATIERIYAAGNQWRELLTAYERRAGLVRDDLKRVEILRRAARVATAKLRDVAEAVRFYEKLHAVDPTDSEALDALEHHYERSRDFEKLHGLLSTRVALSVDEQQIIALNMRIGLLCEEGLRDHDRAITAYRAVVEQQPTHREALDAMARLFEANERWAELIDVTRRQIRLVTDRSQKALLYFKCGSVTEAKFGKEDDAIRYYEAAVRTSAACLPALHSLRDIYIRREDWARVTQTLELESKLWTEDKERAGILAHIGQIYIDKLGFEYEGKAIEFFEQALSVDRDCLPANRALFQIYFSRRDWERALGTSQVLLAKATREGEPSERSEFYRKRAVVALHLGHLRMACESVNTALDVYPENLQVLELLGQLCRRPQLTKLFDFGPVVRELEKQFRRRELLRCQARLLCAQAALNEPNADVEAVEGLLREAVRLSPDDHLPTEALASLYERLRRFREARTVLEAFISHAGEHPGDSNLATLRVRMLLRLAEMVSSSMMESEQAAAILRPLASGAASPQAVPPALRREARFRLAQELYVLGRFAEARTEMESLVEQSSAPAAPAALAVESEELARYHDYLGRTLEALSEDTASQRAYRRAVDLAPSFAQPVLALARRAARAGDRAQAELLMRDALEQLSRRGRQAGSTPGSARESDRFDEELRLRRGIARLLATFDSPQAAEAYQRVIEITTARLPADALRAGSWLDDSSEPAAAWETLDDRVALADLQMHKLGNAGAARQELTRVLLRDLRHSPAYPLLIELYQQIGLLTRAERVRTLLALLGYAGPNPADRRSPPRLAPYRSTLSDELRRRFIWPQALQASPYLELLSSSLDGLLRLFPPPWPLPVEGELQPANRVGDAAFKVALADAQRLFGVEAEVLFGRPVPGYVLALEPVVPGGKPIVVMDQSVLERSDAERRFLLGRAFESLRAGYAILMRLSATESAQWLRLCRGLLSPVAERDGATQDFVAGLSRPNQQVLERLATAERGSGLSPEEFLAALPLLNDRVGLLCCDDIGAAVRVMARAQGEELAVVEGHGGGILLGQVAGGAELARYYLSDSYNELAATLRDTTRL